MPGAPVAEAVLEDVTRRVEALNVSGHSVGLATVLVGDDPASAGYVAKKHEACERVGIDSVDVRLGSDQTQEDLLYALSQLNADPAVDGYILQHPVPAGFDFNEAVAAMDPAKDADGLHPPTSDFWPRRQLLAPSMHTSRHPGDAPSLRHRRWRAGGW